LLHKAQALGTALLKKEKYQCQTKVERADQYILSIQISEAKDQNCPENHFLPLQK